MSEKAGKVKILLLFCAISSVLICWKELQRIVTVWRKLSKVRDIFPAKELLIVQYWPKDGLRSRFDANPVFFALFVWY